MVGPDRDAATVYPALRRVQRDGEYIWQVCCPRCEKWGDVDDDQLHGRVSMLHDECGWHATLDFSNDAFVQQHDEYETTCEAAVADGQNMAKRQGASNAATVEGWDCGDCPYKKRALADAKLERLKADYLALLRWAGQQNAGNAFATQVRMSADARIAEWDLPLEEWEP